VVKAAGSGKQRFGINPPIHPGPQRRLSVETVYVFDLLALCGPGASAVSVPRASFCASQGDIVPTTGGLANQILVESPEIT
jgi:hypothetical protein